MSQMILFRGSFQSVMDHVKVTMDISRVSYGGAKRVHRFGKFRGQTPRGKDFKGSRGSSSSAV